MDNLTYWQTRTLRTQERLAKKTESDVKKQLVKYYRKSAERIIKILRRYMTKSRQRRMLARNQPQQIYIGLINIGKCKDSSNTSFNALAIRA